MRSGADLPAVDPRINHRRHRLGVHRGDQAGSVVARVRGPLQPVGARPAGRLGLPHRGNCQRRCRKPPGQCALRRRRPDPLPAAHRQQQGDPRGGNHGGPYGDAERAPAADSPDHPPSGPDRCVPAHGEAFLRGVLGVQDGHDSRLPPGARAGRGEPARPVTRTRPETVPVAPGLGVGADDPYTPLHVPPPTPKPPTAEQTPVGDSSWWSWWPW